ncbi:ABC tran domain containing protein [Asbolus verrucosus]|uniref:ABC tran domain containing protein n=1 Tax=Asbolus verrucosus TaxID=1661398 RepID=A0A482VGB3_ASBVE|nr:ABC tran domain containing protein [Asbolus verrucosus]
MKIFLCRLSQPIFIWKLLTIKENNLRETEAYVYGSLLVISSFANAILYNWYIFNLRNLSMKVRIACSSLIYRKSLKLNKNNISKTATGQIVNLLSNDLSRFDKLFLQIHYLWAAPLEALIILCLLYVMLDPKGTLGISLFFAFIPIQLYMGKKYSDFRLETAIKTDERVRLINEILSGIQVIKMYTWEKIFIKFTNSIRKQEIRYIRKTSYLKALQNAFNKFLSKGALFLCVMVYIFTGNRLQSQYVFVIKSFYNLLQNNMTTNFPEAIKNIAEASVSVKRIEQFLLYNEIKHNKIQEMQPKKGVYLEKISARWSSAVSDTLSEISFEATLGQLVTIVGTVGSGKTSLINVILHELPLAKGRINIAGNISYASQEPWLFGGTIKQNILFGQPLDDVKYEEVVNVCALNHDFELLPYGDNSIVGDRGITLSGGQKARINLARAVYRNADIYLLDDPLSAVDASVGKQLFNECILNYLKNKCVVLVTHQLQYLKKSDIIYLLKNGKIIASGNYEHIRNCGEDFARLLNKEVEYEDNSTDNAMNQKLLNQKEEKQFYENRSFGTIPLKVYFSYLLSGGWCASSVIVIMFIVSQSLLSGVDYFESYW